MIDCKDSYIIWFFNVYICLAACLYQQWRGYECWRVLSFLLLPVSWNLIWFTWRVGMLFLLPSFCFNLWLKIEEMFLFSVGSKQDKIPLDSAMKWTAVWGFDHLLKTWRLFLIWRFGSIVWWKEHGMKLVAYITTK